MEDTDPTAASRTQTRQPKKRFVGRRTADAQSQNEPSTTSDTTVQKGMYRLMDVLFILYAANFILKQPQEEHQGLSIMSHRRFLRTPIF